MKKVFTQLTLGSKFFVFIRNVWAKKCLTEIQESLNKISRSKNKNTSYR